jgi:VanZ family protein
VLVLALSLVPRPVPVPGRFPWADKVAHAVAYIGLAFFAVCAVDRRGALPFTLVLAACLVFGGAIEALQPLVGRSRDIGDLIADAAGAAIGSTAAAVRQRCAVLAGTRGDLATRRFTSGGSP